MIVSDDWVGSYLSKIQIMFFFVVGLQDCKLEAGMKSG